MALFDCAQIRLVCLRERGVEQLLESISDTRNGGVHDQHPRATFDAGAGHIGNVSPVGER
jgi:hypothetical protein